MIEIGQELYNQQRHPRFGTSNPERMRLAFWEWMIRGENSPLAEDKRGLAQAGWSVQDGKLKSTYGPYRARQHFSVPISCEDGPIWTFERMGRTQTQLPDGRIVCVGGEHEDFYDPDFFIYNDVVVLGPQDELEIYGYPKEVFPPTDFHSATLLEDEFVIVGGLGYKGERRFGFTPVYRLDLSDYHIEELRTSSEMPGWIFQPTAHLDGDTIVVKGGETVRERDGEELYRPNVEEFALDIQSSQWRQLTRRNWRQFRIRPEERTPFLLEDRPKPRNLLPTGVKHTVLQCDEWIRARFAVDGVSLDLKVGVSDVRILIEGDLAADVTDKALQEIRDRTEKAVGRRCLLDEV